MSEANNKTYNHYLIFLMGQMISIVGSSVVFFAVIWYITIETANATVISISATLSFLPQLIMIPIAGTLADMWDRKKTIIISDTMQAATTFVIILSFLLGNPNIWVIISMNAVRGVFNTFHRPAVNAIIPMMVPREKLSRLNGFRMLSGNVITILSPGISALLLNVLSFQQILWIDVITAGLALIPLAFITVPKLAKKPKSSKQAKFWHNFKEGFVTIKETPGLLIMGIWSALLNFLIVPFNVLMPYFVRFAHDGLETNLALVMTGTQIGFVLGSLICSIKKKWNNKIKVIIYTGVLFCIGNIIAAIAPYQQFWVMFIGRLLFGATISIGISMYMTIMQLAVPMEKQGRIFSFDNFISTAITPISMLFAGPIVEQVGVVPFFVSLGILGIVVNIGIAMSGVMKIKYSDAPETVDETISSPLSANDEKPQEVPTQG